MRLDFISTDANQPLVGKSIAEVAEARNATGEETMLALIDEEDNMVGIVLHNRVEPDVRYFLAHPLAPMLINKDIEGVHSGPLGLFPERWWVPVELQRR